jgi:ATP-dependent helicase/nuclease subunit B
LKRAAFYTIAPSAAFAQTLAEGLLARTGGDALKLSSATIYLPTRRAARGFGDVFARVLGGAALLPQLRALGEAEEDELLFDAASEGLELLPAIAPLRRQLLLAQLVRAWDRKDRDGRMSIAQAASLAASLAKVMDEVEIQGADLGALAGLVPAELAQHWEGVTRFLGVLETEWPKLLEAEGLLNPAARRGAALAALAARLEAAPPDDMVIAAGTTGSIPATAALLGVIARLPQGAVVLPGLDREMDAESWANLDPGHPQYGLRQLLERTGVARADVKDWQRTACNGPRETLLRETLRPAPTTDAWRALAERGGGGIAEGLAGLSLVACADPGEEALAIALALRDSLEAEGRTAALVTPDRNLARRVAAEMRRWGVTIDDSAGRPLAHTGAGGFLCLVAEAAESDFAPVPLLALLKHPFARRGRDSAEFRRQARALDRWCLRGPRPDAGLAGIARAIAAALAQPRNAEIAAPLAELARWWDEVAACLAPLESLFAHREVTLDRLLEAHVAAAEALACDEQANCILWAERDGEAAAAFVSALKLASEGLPPAEPDAWPALFRALAMGVPVRAPFSHPRLAILGPLEARLQRYDLTVLGGLNEGSWPGGPGSDPWFSRPMRASLGLEQPERAIGLAAHDFASLAAAPRVLMTRALKADGAPTLPARWLQRLEQLTRGLGLSLAPATDYAAMARAMMDVPPAPRLARPAPVPPREARPRRLSVTEIETWLRDPYAIYARHVLKLRPLDPLDAAIGPMERGNALHKALELFVARFPGALPDDAALELARIADGVFAEAGIPKAALAVWRPRFFGAAHAFVAFEQARRGQIAASHLEIRGSRVFPAPGGDFTLTGVADRIDLGKDGKAAILDYKSGRIPSAKQVREFLSPQLPLEGAILAAGGFAGLGPRIAGELIYVSLAGAEEAAKPQWIEDAPLLAEKAAEKLAQRIQWFDEETTPYYPRLKPYRTDSAGDYDHLARVREWAPPGWGEEEA